MRQCTLQASLVSPVRRFAFRFPEKETAGMVVDDGFPKPANGCINHVLACKAHHVPIVSHFPGVEEILPFTFSIDRNMTAMMFSPET